MFYDMQAIKKLPYSQDAINLLLKMLERNPDKRITAKNALYHPFIGEPKELFC
jgi:serine/threonine protein kinase